MNEKKPEPVGLTMKSPPSSGDWPGCLSLPIHILIYIVLSFFIGPLICVALIVVCVIMIPISLITGAEFPKVGKWIATWMEFVDRLAG